MFVRLITASLRLLVIFVPLFVIAKPVFALCEVDQSYPMCMSNSDFNLGRCECFPYDPPYDPSQLSWCWRLELEPGGSCGPDESYVRYTSVNNCYKSDYCGGGGPECFLAGTKIDTPFGQRNIEDLKQGDAVYSFDKESKKVVLNTVEEPFVSTRSGYYLIKTVSGREIRVTAEHPFYVGNEPKFLSANLKLLALPFNHLYSL